MCESSLTISGALADYVEEISIQAPAVLPDARPRPDCAANPDTYPGPYRVLPKPFAVLGFQYRGRLWVGKPGGPELLAAAGVTGLQREARQFRPVAQTRTILVTLKPHAAFALLGSAMDELANAHIPLDALLLSSTVHEVTEQLAEASGAHARSEIVQAFLLRLLKATQRSPHPAVVAATQRIVQTHGAARIESLASELTISRRHLERLFQQQVGTGPKEFASLARFDWVVKHASMRASWGALAHEAGYADQAHLIRSFEARAGVSPSAHLTGVRDA